MSFRERVALADGTLLELRAIQPSDSAALAEAFSRLSPDSRRSRFHAAKAVLSDSELRFLTECDGQTHYAIVATCDDAGSGQPTGVGVVRFIVSDHDPTVAELAVTVGDKWQGRGIGGLLLQRIAAAAAERHVERLQAVLLADNKKVKGLIGHYSDTAACRQEDGLLMVDHHLSS
ncbi:MAG: GNAT family N-acetyltransferase [Gammaproteobacteria bacterium]